MTTAPAEKLGEIQGDPRRLSGASPPSSFAPAAGEDLTFF